MLLVSGVGGKAVIPTLKHEDRRFLRAAQITRGLDDRLENRPQRIGRPADDLQHLGRRSLEPQRLGKVARPGLHLVEQARVLNGDRRLIGKTLDELDLALGERLGFGSAKAEDPDQFVLAH